MPTPDKDLLIQGMLSAHQIASEGSRSTPVEEALRDLIDAIPEDTFAADPVLRLWAARRSSEFQSRGTGLEVTGKDGDAGERALTASRLTPLSVEQAKHNLIAFIDPADGVTAQRVLMSIDALIAAVSRSALGDWQPIETAPKDGTWILGVRNADERPCYAVVNWEGIWTDGEYTYSLLTHWIPLPPPPVVVHVHSANYGGIG